MSGRYYLACSCGVQHVVEPRQAGEMIACSCGRRLEVPTLVGLRKLPPVKEEFPAEEPRPRWSATQAAVFTIGLLLALACLCFLAYASYRWLSISNTEKPDITRVEFEHDLDKMPGEKLYDAWLIVSQGLPERHMTPAYLLNRENAAGWFLATIGGVFTTLVALGIMGSAFFLVDHGPPPRRE